MKSPIRFSSNTSRNVKLVLTSFLIVAVGACSPGFSPKFASQQRMLLPEIPDQTLTPTIDDPTPAQDPIYNIYRLVSAKFGASASKKEISARIEVKSTQGTETVDLLGKIRDDGRATLIDIQPLEGGKNRLVAEAFCQDGPECKQIILNVIFKVGNRTLQKQFVSEAFRQSVGEKPRPTTPTVTSTGQGSPAPNADGTTAPTDKTTDRTGNSPGNSTDDSTDNGATDTTDTTGDNTPGAVNPDDDTANANSVHHRVPKNKIIRAQPMPPTLVPPAPGAAPVASAPGATTAPAPGAPASGAPTGTTPPTPATGAANGTQAGTTTPAPATNSPNLNDSADDDGEMTDLDNGGEYVGAQPPENIVAGLWVRPEVPAPPIQLPAAAGKKTQLVTKTPAAPAPAPGASGSASPTGNGSTTNPMGPNDYPPAGDSNSENTQPNLPVSLVGGDSGSNGALTNTAPNINMGEEGSPASAPATAAPETLPNGAPSVPSAPAARPAPTTTTPPKAAPAPASGGKTSPAPARPAQRTSAPPPPAIAKSEDIPQDANKTELEQRMSPMLDLQNGGKAIGNYNTGRLVSAQPLAGNGVFHVIYPSKGTQYGTGMMISLIKNASSLMPASFPDQDISVLIGDIAKQNGGNVGHASHQNGLDIDIPYIGEPGFKYISDGRTVDADFDYSKTWQFLRLVHSQKLMLNGREQSALSMVFVDRSIKVGFCRWAKNHDLLKNSEDADILRRLFPWEGHRNHFHVRLKCSPHYPACQNRNDPAPGTGC